MQTQKLIKLIAIVFFVWLIVTYIPNRFLHDWWFLLLVFAMFYFAAQWVKRKFKRDLFMNTALIGSVILGIVSVILNRMGF